MNNQIRTVFLALHVFLQKMFQWLQGFYLLLFKLRCLTPYVVWNTWKPASSTSWVMTQLSDTVSDNSYSLFYLRNLFAKEFFAGLHIAETKLHSVQACKNGKRGFSSFLISWHNVDMSHILPDFYRWNRMFAISQDQWCKSKTNASLWLAFFLTSFPVFAIGKSLCSMSVSIPTTLKHIFSI